MPPLDSERVTNPTVEAENGDENAATIIEPVEPVLDSQADVATIIDSESNISVFQVTSQAKAMAR